MARRKCQRQVVVAVVAVAVAAVVVARELPPVSELEWEQGSESEWEQGSELVRLSEKETAKTTASAMPMG